MDRSILLLIGLVVLSAVFAVYPEKLFHYTSGKFVCSNNNQFLNDAGATDALPKNNIINDSGTVNYFKDNFDGYSQNSKAIEQFDNLKNIELKGSFSDEKLSSDRISGLSALSVQVLPNGEEGNFLTIRKNLSQPLDLEKWNDSGILSMWMKIADRKGISEIGLKVGDKDNNYREFQEIQNLQVDIPNNYDSDDVYPDIELSRDDLSSREWTDFWLNKGWNYFFWQTGKANSFSWGNPDIKNITWFEITLNGDKNISKQEILLDDFRIQDGIQKEANSLSGQWYPPEAKPQNGIYDIDQISKENYAAKLLNVRQTQYSTNKDRGGMVLGYGTPMNFSLRTRFTLTNFPKNDQERVNTWFKVAYDFDSSYEPGHDWFASFISFEWNKFGLTAIVPIEKDSVQEWEPKNENLVGSSIDFIPQENVPYEIHLTVKGQKATASIYEAKNNCLALKGQTSYEFQKPRQVNDEKNPFYLEITGNVKAYISEVEIKEL